MMMSLFHSIYYISLPSFVNKETSNFINGKVCDIEMMISLLIQYIYVFLLLLRNLCYSVLCFPENL